MSAHLSGWLAQAWATDSPVLPTASAMQVWLHLGWSVVLAWLGAGLVARLLASRAHAVQGQWVAALALAAWAWVPGSGGAAYWLGLAFQAPSASSVLWCAAMLATRRRASGGAHGTLRFTGNAMFTDGQSLWLAGLGALLGWALLLDSIAMLPMQMYAWGFSPWALGLVVLAALLPWVAGRPTARPRGWMALCVVPLAALVFVAVRLPTGNVWDAVLDPWVWLALQVWLARRGLSRYKNNS
jgi:hypothetical protein